MLPCQPLVTAGVDFTHTKKHKGMTVGEKEMGSMSNGGERMQAGRMQSVTQTLSRKTEDASLEAGDDEALRNRGLRRRGPSAG